jgi:hypothetical protein
MNAACPRGFRESQEAVFRLVIEIAGFQIVHRGTRTFATDTKLFVATCTVLGAGDGTFLE